MVRHDLECPAECGHTEPDHVFADSDRIDQQMPLCPRCSKPLIIRYSPRPFGAALGDADAVVVFRDRDGNVRYPGRNDVPTPPDCERVVMRRLHEVDAFSKANRVVHEASHYDGSGRGHERG